MKGIQVKEVMIPIANYVTVKKEDSLIDVLIALDATQKSDKDHAHRDAMVVDGNGDIIGKVTIIDIFRALEPNYKRIPVGKPKGVLTREFVMKAVRDFNLWMEPLQDICDRGKDLRVGDIMYTPKGVEYLEETDSLERALADYVMGVHQPLIVKNAGVVTGILRFGDVFEVVRKSLLSCDI